MDRNTKIFFAVVAASTAFCASVSADIVFQQLPTQLGGLGSDTLFRDQLNRVVWQQEADDVVLSAPATIRRVSWHGFYGGSGTPVTPPPPTESMRIRFYAARAGDGLPDDDNILLEETHLDPLRVETGLTIAVGGVPAEYRYQIDLAIPLLLESATPYWLEIVQLGDVDSHFRWEGAFGTGNLHSFKHIFLPTWQASTGNLAFELSTVPEPTTLILFFAGLGAVLDFRKTPTSRSKN